MNSSSFSRSGYSNWALKSHGGSFRSGSSSIKVAAVLKGKTNQTPRKDTDEIIININYAQVLGLRGRDFYLDPQIATAHDHLKSVPLEEGYSHIAILGKEKLLSAAQDGLSSARGRIALIQPELTIDPMLIPGTMALLEQTGHYETVIQLAQQAQSLSDQDLKSLGATQANLIDWHRDVTLAAALAHCGMAKTSIEERHAAMGCAQLEEALAILHNGLPSATPTLKSSLKQTPLAPQLQMNINTALSDFKAEAILDFLRKPLDLAHVMQRQQVLAALSDMLNHPQELPEQEPAGFVAHALKFLTAEETCCLLPNWEKVIIQQSLLLNTSQQDGSSSSITPVDASSVLWCSPAVASHVALSYLVAGFVQRRPQLVATAQRIFASIRNVADVAVPSAVCDVLLGRPNAALDTLRDDENIGAVLRAKAGLPPLPSSSSSSKYNNNNTIRAAQRSQQRPSSNASSSAPLKFPERDAVMSFIRSHSPTEKDLLPGLCLFIEGYLHCKAFPQIRDTKERVPDASLSLYFDDPKTAASLEHSDKASSIVQSVGRAVDGLIQSAVSFVVSSSSTKTKNSTSGSTTTNTDSNNKKNGLLVLLLSAVDTQRKSVALLAGSAVLVACAVFGINRWSTATATAQRRQPAVAPGSVAAAVRSGYWQSSVYARQAKEHHSQLLTKDTAQSLIQDWLNIKAEAMGPRHKISRLSSVLAEPMLSAVTTEAKEAAASGWFWNIRPLKTRIISIDSSALTPESGYAVVTASVDESADLWATNGKKGDSYKSEYRVEYCVVRSGGGWKVASALVLGR